METKIMVILIFAWLLIPLYGGLFVSVSQGEGAQEGFAPSGFHHRAPPTVLGRYILIEGLPSF